MHTYLGRKYDNYYIMCRDFNEVYSFDSFGNVVSKDGGVISCDSWVEVGALSFVGEGGSCEVMYDGYVASISIPILNAISKIRDEGKYLGTIFNVVHEDDFGRFNQILFVYPKSIDLKSILGKHFNGLVWNPLN